MNKIRKLLYFIGDHPIISAFFVMPFSFGISYIILGKMALIFPFIGILLGFGILLRIRIWRQEIVAAEIKQDWIDYQAKQTALELDKLQHPEKYQDIES